MKVERRVASTAVKRAVKRAAMMAALKADLRAAKMVAMTAYRLVELTVVKMAV